MIAWRIATETQFHKADDATGEGAKISGGRWNNKGTALIYTATTRALACLETIVHLNALKLPVNRYLVSFDIPETIWNKRETLSVEEMEAGWDDKPPGTTSKNFGDKWAKENRSCILEVPSVIICEEMNVLINPEHPDAKHITVTPVRKWEYDARLIT